MHGINSLQTCMLPRQMGDAAHLGFYTGAFNGCVYIGSALSTYVFAQVSETFGWNGTVLVWCVTAGLGGAPMPFAEPAKRRNCIKQKPRSDGCQSGVCISFIHRT